MANKNAQSRASALRYDAQDIARLTNKQALENPLANGGMVELGQSPRSSTKGLRRRFDGLVIRVGVCLLALLILGFVSLCFSGPAAGGMHMGTAYEAFNPGQVLAALMEHVRNAISDLMPSKAYHTVEQIEAKVPCYWVVGQQMSNMLATMVSGALLGVSGLLFQRALRTPLASPVLLGTGGGNVLGVLILVCMFGLNASNLVELRYVLCIGFGIALTALVLLASARLGSARLGSGETKTSVSALILMGVAVSQIVAVIAVFALAIFFALGMFDECMSLVFMTRMDASVFSWIVLLAGCAGAFLPAYLLRFRMNVLSLDGEEALYMGQSPQRMRMLALCFGTVMAAIALAQVGLIGLVALAVPLAARWIFAAEFSHSFAGCACIGALVLSVSRLLFNVIPLGSTGIPVAVIAAVLMLPVFVILVIKVVKGVD